jgi:2-methylcitrate dehydratase PrpD
MNYITRLAEFASITRLKDIPINVRTHAKKIIMDTMAVIARGYLEAEYIQNLANMMRNDGRCTILGCDARVKEQTAALINSSSGTVLELDEGHRIAGSHAAVQILPATLAASEFTACSGKEFLEAFIIGYEVGTRIGYALKPFREGLHTHGTWASIGAAIAISLVFDKRDQEFLENIMRIAANMAHSTSWETAITGATIRNVYAGLASLAGFLSYSFSNAGIKGQKNALISSLAKAISSTGKINANPLINLEKEYFITKNYFKIFPCCGYTHAAIEATLSIKNEIEIDQIGKIIVYTFRDAAMLNSKNPKNSLAAKFSIPYIIAKTLLEDELNIESFKDEKVAKKDWKKIAKVVSVVQDDEINRMFPEMWGAKVSIVLNNGKKFEKFVDNPRGDWRKPFDEKQLLSKFESTLPYILKNNNKEILQKINTLEKLSTINMLTDLFAPNR